MSAVFRLCAQSYTHALLTIGTSVKPHGREENAGSVGVIRDIREGGLPNVLVLWPDRIWPEWVNGENLERVGRAVRGPR